MGSALDTFCGQSYGARQYNMLGTHAQRAIIVLMFMGVPLAFILAFTGQILISLGQNPEISSEAGLYAQWLIPVFSHMVCFSASPDSCRPKILYKYL